MPPNPIQHLLDQWEHLTLHGKDLAIDILCKDQPHLAGEVQQRIHALDALGWITSLATNQNPGNELPGFLESLKASTGFHLVRKLGRGGFGEVWEAVDEKGIHKALKIIPEGTNARKEWKALERIAEIQHEHLLGIENFLQVDTFLVVVMELAEESLCPSGQVQVKRI